MARRPTGRLVLALACFAVYTAWRAVPLVYAAPASAVSPAGSVWSPSVSKAVDGSNQSGEAKPQQNFACKEGTCNTCFFHESEVEERETSRLEGVVGGGIGRGKSRLHRRKGTRVAKSELEARGIRYLQVGGDWWNKCGDGWLNADAVFTKIPTGFVCEDWRTRRNIMRLDAGSAFPIEDESFEVIYTEHMFEHMLPVHGTEFLREAYRLLKPGGVLRVTTPDLQKYIVSAAASYSNGMLDAFLADHAAHFPPMGELGKPYSAATVINNIFRNYKHQWIYDFEEMVSVHTLNPVHQHKVVGTPTVVLLHA